jgi:beta-xylosidase
MSTSNISDTLTYTNPVYPEYFADPFVFLHDGRYYAVGTGPAEAESKVDGAVPKAVFPMLTSQDLVHWTFLGHALRGYDPVFDLGDSFWAPEIAFADGMFYMYYSVGRGEKGHHLRVAVSRHPGGPYRDLGALLKDPSEWRFAIDPHPFRDSDGSWYMFFAADFLDFDPPETPGGARPGTALVVQPMESMISLAQGRSRVVMRASCDWQRYEADRKIYGDRFDWHTLEGPCVRKFGDKYYCFYSGGCWRTPGYGVDYVVADNVMGPYSAAGGEDGPRILKTIPDHMLGPGHNSIVTGPDGESLFVVYHAWDPEKTGRRLCIDRLMRTPKGPRCLGPTWTPQSL